MCGEKTIWFDKVCDTSASKSLARRASDEMFNAAFESAMVESSNWLDYIYGVAAPVIDRDKDVAAYTSTKW